ncbi:MAG: NADH-quinone oxidoreductase subunit J [Deltaproteobacteria bacterium]|nr:NADH-quinone oxidoreductase subunit J [Deltaproteobacteria bacterium]
MVVGSAAYVAVSKNIVRCAFALVYTFIGVAGLFVLLSADFIAATQVLVYVGGTLVLILFAVMLSSRISDVKISNRSVQFIPGFVVTCCFAVILIYIAVSGQWPIKDVIEFSPTTAAIGNSLLSRWLLPFEVISILILVGLMGAVVIARHKINSKGDAK